MGFERAYKEIDREEKVINGRIHYRTLNWDHKGETTFWSAWEKILTVEEQQAQDEKFTRFMQKQNNVQIQADNEYLNKKVFKDNNTLYLIDIQKTFKIKEQLKKDGAIWLDYFGVWAMKTNEHKEKYPLVKVDYIDLINIDSDGKHTLKTENEIENHLNSLPKEI